MAVGNKGQYYEICFCTIKQINLMENEMKPPLTAEFKVAKNLMDLVIARIDETGYFSMGFCGIDELENPAGGPVTFCISDEFGELTRFKWENDIVQNLPDNADAETDPMEDKVYKYFSIKEKIYKAWIFFLLFEIDVLQKSIQTKEAEKIPEKRRRGRKAANPQL